jgi:hypothetical protein
MAFHNFKLHRGRRTDCPSCRALDGLPVKRNKNWWKNRGRQQRTPAPPPMNAAAVDLVYTTLQVSN